MIDQTYDPRLIKAEQDAREMTLAALHRRVVQLSTWLKTCHCPDTELQRMGYHDVLVERIERASKAGY